MYKTELTKIDQKPHKMEHRRIDADNKRTENHHKKIENHHIMHPIPEKHA